MTRACAVGYHSDPPVLHGPPEVLSDTRCRAYRRDCARLPSANGSLLRPARTARVGHPRSTRDRVPGRRRHLRVHRPAFASPDAPCRGRSGRVFRISRLGCRLCRSARLRVRTRGERPGEVARGRCLSNRLAREAGDPHTQILGLEIETSPPGSATRQHDPGPWVPFPPGNATETAPFSSSPLTPRLRLGDISQTQNRVLAAGQPRGRATPRSRPIQPGSIRQQRSMAR